MPEPAPTRPRSILWTIVVLAAVVVGAWRQMHAGRVAPSAPSPSAGGASTPVPSVPAPSAPGPVPPERAPAQRAPGAAPAQRPPDAQRTRPAPTPARGEAAILDAFKRGTSDVKVEASGTVKKVLPDDREGDRHQKFIVRLSGGHTILIAHNIDLAPRVPVEEGDGVEFRGEYEWSEQGGVVHWTHKDPARRHADGWIRHNAKLYQ